MSGGTYILLSTLNDGVLRNFLWHFYFYAHSFRQKVAARKLFFILRFLLRCLRSNHGLSSTVTSVVLVGVNNLMLIALSVDRNENNSITLCFVNCMQSYKTQTIRIIEQPTFLKVKRSYNLSILPPLSPDNLSVYHLCLRTKLSGVYP